jgi:tRNA threonylcarbamoyladenosine biosynthesis protein TsaE
MSEFKFEAADEEVTQRLGAALAAVLPAGTTVSLIGTLGAGKTRLVQAIAAACGVLRDEVVSPTFVLFQQYRANRIINHVDAYRLRDEDEFRELGGEELLSSDAITLIEWADRITDALPDDYMQIEITVQGPTARRFVVRAMGEKHKNVIAELARAASAQ